MPSEGMYQVLGTLISFSSGLASGEFSMIFLARNRPAPLPPSFPWQRGGMTILPIRP